MYKDVEIYDRSTSIILWRGDSLAEAAKYCGLDKGSISKYMKRGFPVDFKYLIKCKEYQETSGKSVSVNLKIRSCLHCGGGFMTSPYVRICPKCRQVVNSYRRDGDYIY
jgi:hypothetical protein